MSRPAAFNGSSSKALSSGRVLLLIAGLLPGAFAAAAGGVEADVRRFGALANGSHDDAPAIQAAIDAVGAAGGGLVYVPPGAYLLFSPIVLRSRVELAGAGIDVSTLEQAGSLESWQLPTQRALGILWTPASGTYDRIHLRDFSLRGLYHVPISYRTAGPHARAGIYVQRAQRSRVERVAVRDTASGIVFTGDPGVPFADNVVDSCEVTNAASWDSATFNDRPRGVNIRQNGVKVTRTKVTDSVTGFYVSGDSVDVDQCWAEGGTAETDNGFYYQSSHGKLTNSTASNIPAGSGFAVAYESDVTVIGNHALSCGNMGFRLHVPMSYSRIIGNEAIGCGAGFAVDISSHTWPRDRMRGMAIIGNTARGNQNQGFLLRWMEDSVVTGNTAIDNNQAGVRQSTRGAIYLGAYFINNTLSDNVCADTQATPTQLFGLYSSTRADSGASVDNTGNSIRHRSVTGLDQLPSHDGPTR